MIDFAMNNARTGFRLHQLEVLNWGTFHNQIWTLTPDGNNSLLTGDIGSGKSTLVDALTILLVPHQKITFNKAAGADTKERTIASYIRGDYSTKKGAYDGSSKAVSLRPEGTYSVILGVFYNAGFAQTISLAQVLWLDNGKENKFFVVAGQGLSIRNDFTGFGKDISQLKKRIKNTPGAEVFDTFKDYSLKFRSVFALKSEKALDLFYQTISMKSVSNLNDFVRNQMLEKAEVKEKIDELKRNYDNLTKSYQAIQTAKHQLSQLKPLMAQADQFLEVESAIRELEALLETLPAYFNGEKAKLLTAAIQLESVELEHLTAQLVTLAEDIGQLRQKEFELRNDIANNAKGKELERIRERLHETEKNRKDKWAKAQEYNRLATGLELKAVAEEGAFLEARQSATGLKERISAELTGLIAERDGLNVNLNRQQELLAKEQTELTSLRQRKTQIPEDNLKIRQLLLEHTGLTEADLPFVGELLQVKPTEKDWEGAIERLLHGFGLSVLVPEAHYRRISELVDNTNLRGRIVYFRVPPQVKPNLSAQIPEDSLFEKIEIKHDSPFYDWLENELIQHFDFICCQTLDQFGRTPKAITKNGQIKSGKARHEKDDRRSILDRKHYILGWSNTEKMKVIEKEIKGLEKTIGEVQKGMQTIQKRQQFLGGQDRNLHDFLKFSHFAEIHWQKEATEIERLKADKEALEKSSDQLKQLEKQLKLVQDQLGQLEKEKGNKVKRQGEIEGNIKTLEEGLADCRATEGLLTESARKQYFPRLQSYYDPQAATVKTIDKLRDDVRKKISAQKDKEGEIHRQLLTKVVKKMQDYKRDYPAEPSEADADVKSIPEFRTFLQKVEDEDLPRSTSTVSNPSHQPGAGWLDTSLQTREYVESLEEELKQTKEKLQATQEKLEAMEENMLSFNEELLSANEEMQSTNEEMQSSNEELQSVNEELQNVNSEYQGKIKELTQLNDDLNNYFRSNVNGQVFVDRALNLKKFSPSIVELINLQERDIGRPLDHITTNIKFETLREDMTQVIREGGIIVKEVQAGHKCYQVMTMPYIRQSDNKIEGAILTFYDITELKRLQTELESRNQRLIRINEDLDTFVYTASHDLLNPLANIQALIELIHMTDQRLTPEAEKFYQMIDTAIIKFTALIRELSNIGKVESENLKEGQEVFFEELVEDIKLSVSSLIESTHTHIETNFQVHSIYFSKKNLRSILYNLITNAIKYKSSQRAPQSIHSVNYTYFTGWIR